MEENKRRIFYGWIVCGACTVLIFVTMGTASNCLSVFMPYIREAYGLTNAQTSSLVTLRCVFAFVAMLAVGKYYETFGYRIGTGLAALCCAAAYVIYSRAAGYMGFCIGASMGGISYGLGSMIPVSILMNRWFIKHRALAIGICSAGSGLAVIIMPGILTGIILKSSITTAFYFVAAYVVVFAILIFALIRESPSSMGLEALGKREQIQAYRSQDRDDRKKSAEKAVRRDAHMIRTLSLRDWILMGVISMFMGAMANPGFMHLTMLYSTEGFHPMLVALIVSIDGIVLTCFKIVLGETADRLGGFRASMLFMAILLTGHVFCCMAFTGSVPIALIGAVILGMGYSITTVGIPIWAGDLMPQSRYGEAVRRMQLSYAAGAMLFASVPGILADALGGYIPTYVLFGILLIISGACLAIVYSRRSMKE